MPTLRPTTPSAISILRLRGAGAAALLALALPAQRPPAFADLTPPAGVNLANLQVPPTGKLALYRSGQYLRVFSTVTGSWHAHTPSFGTTPILTDELLLVPAAGEQRVELGWPLPNLPALRRTEWFEQALVLPPTGQAWLTAASSVFLL